MKDLKVNSTPKTPEIDFNLATGVFLVSGVSVPENSMEFYGVVIDWLKEFVKNPPKTTKIVFKLTYVNTSSLQFIYDMLILMDTINTDENNISIDWYYYDEDIDMKEMGEDFKDALGIDFHFFDVEAV